MTSIVKKEIDELLRITKELENWKHENNSDVLKVISKIYHAGEEKNSPSWYEWKVGFANSENCIDVSWEYYWRYGGHDLGDFSFPIQCLYDEKFLNDYIEKINQKQKLKDEAEKQTEYEELKRRYEWAKKELEEADN